LSGNISCGGKGGRCVGLTTLKPSYADCLEIWEPHAPGILRVCPRGDDLPLPLPTIFRKILRHRRSQKSVQLLNYVQTDGWTMIIIDVTLGSRSDQNVFIF